MNQLSLEKRCQVVACLVEGNSLRATCRMTGAAMNTVLKLLADLGTACAEYQGRTMKNLPCRVLECDEIWAFVYAKKQNLPQELQGEFGYGDLWTWVAIDADTKLIPTWLVGPRDSDCAAMFIDDLAGRLANRVQLSTDGLHMYLKAVESSFGSEIDYAQISKMYGKAYENRSTQARYSPPECIAIRKLTVTGQPEEARISTSYVERQNLTMRMNMRRFTRLTNGFSKKAENHAHAVAIHFMHYNFVRKHQTLGKTPAQAAGLTDRKWEIADMLALLNSN
jgi:IS1 family transposase